MYRILVPVDDDERRAKQTAEAITDLPLETSRVEAVVLNVHEKVEAVGEEGRVSSGDYYDKNDAPESVDIAAKPLEAAGITVMKRREHGTPTEEILAVAEEINANSIAISGRKRSPAGKAIFGSVTQSVLLSADIPVITTMGN